MPANRRLRAWSVIEPACQHITPHFMLNKHTLQMFFKGWKLSVITSAHVLPKLLGTPQSVHNWGPLFDVHIGLYVSRRKKTNFLECLCGICQPVYCSYLVSLTSRETHPTGQLSMLKTKAYKLEKMGLLFLLWNVQRRNTAINCACSMSTGSGFIKSNIQ